MAVTLSSCAQRMVLSLMAWNSSARPPGPDSKATLRLVELRMPLGPK